VALEGVKVRSPELRGSGVTLPIARSLTMVAAVTGAIEVAFDRIIVPTLSHAVGPSLAPLATASGVVARLMVAVTLAFVVGAAVAWATVLWHTSPGAAVGIGIAVWAALATGLLDSSLAAAVLRISVTVALAVVVVTMLRPGLAAIGVGSAAVAVVAGQWSVVGHVLGLRIVAEFALAAALVILAVAVAGRTRSRLAVAGSSIAAGVAVVALSSEQGPLLALWASGAALWMPSLVYVATAAAAGLLLATWLARARTRYLAAGVCLLLIAGVAPAFAHHSLTGLVAVIALATYAGADEGAPWL